MTNESDETSDFDPKSLPDYRSFPKTKTQQIVKNFPPHLKDPANYDKIQKAIIEAGATKCSHGEIGEWAKCKKCQWALAKRSETMKKLGFKTSAHYLMWKKIHGQIKILEKDRLPKYNAL